MATFLGYSNFNGKYGDKFSADLLYDIIERSISGNYTKVRLYGYIRSWDGYSGSGAAATFYINGEASGTFTSIVGNQYKEVARKDVQVKHDSKGKGVLNWSLSVDTSWTLGDASASGTLNLPDIPRTSSVTCTDGNIGSSVSININRADNSFKHTLRYDFGSLKNQTIATKISDASYGWPLPTTFYAQIPNTKSGVCTVYCDTYSGDTLIGTSSCKFNAKVDETKCRPTVTATIEDINPTTLALTGDKNKLIRYKSNVKITINATAKNSATIKNRTVVCGDGQKGSGATVTLNNVGSGQFTISAEDSRSIIGYTDPNPMTKSIIEYIPLTINPDFYRPQPTTGEITLKYSGNYFNGSLGSTNNSLTVRWRYREVGATSWQEYKTITPTISGNTYSQTISLGKTFDYRKSYEFEIQATDKLGTVPETSITYKVGEGEAILGLFKNYIKMFGSTVFTEDNGVVKLNPDLICRVGDLWFSTINENPSVRFGGTWVLWGQGRVPVGVDTSQTEFNTVEKTGGSKYLQKHVHGLLNMGGQILVSETGNIGAWRQSGDRNTLEAGEGDSGNLQPYITCYMWKRTT